MNIRATFIYLATAGILAGTTGCGDETGPLEPDAIVRDTTSLFQTDSLRYTLASRSFGYEVTIAATFTNRTGAEVHIVNCNGSTSMQLEKRAAGQWQRVWSPVIPLCLSPPITIAPGATYRAQVAIFGGFPGGNLHPQFTTTDLTGEYRLVWDQVLSTYQDKLPFGTPLPLESRRSNVFALTVKGS